MCHHRVEGEEGGAGEREEMGREEGTRRKRRNCINGGSTCKELVVKARVPRADAVL